MTPDANTPRCFTETCRHKNFDDVLTNILDRIREPNGAKLILVIGGPAVGKTTLFSQLQQAILKESEEEMKRDPEFIPIAAITAKAPGPVAFNWKHIYIRWLKALHHPFPDVRRIPRRELCSAQENANVSIQAEKIHRIAADPLFERLLTAQQHRRPKALPIDEAQHLLRLTTSQSFESQLEHLKYLADESLAPLVLFGPASLLKMADHSAQIVRRRAIVHFNRYTYDPNKPLGGLEPFGHALKFYAADLKTAPGFDIMKQATYFFQGSAGLVGSLHRWLYRAWRRAGGRTLTQSDFEATIPTVKDRAKLLMESKQIEAYFESDPEEGNKYLRALGFLEDTSGQEPKPKPKPKRPGKRNPHRDPVGPNSANPTPFDASKN